MKTKISLYEDHTDGDYIDTALEYTDGVVLDDFINHFRRLLLGLGFEQTAVNAFFPVVEESLKDEKED